MSTTACAPCDRFVHTNNTIIIMCNIITVFMLIERKLKIMMILNFAQISGKGRHTLH